MSNDNTPALTLETLLEKIDRIVVENDYIRDAMKAFGAAEEIDNLVEMASTLASIVEVRERTNRDIIALYSKMYEDLRPDKMQQLKQINEIFKCTDPPPHQFVKDIASKLLGIQQG